MTNQAISLYCPDCDDNRTFQRSLQSALGYACNSCEYFVLDEGISNQTQDKLISIEESFDPKLGSEALALIRRAIEKRWGAVVADNASIFFHEDDWTWCFVRHPSSERSYVDFLAADTVRFWHYDQDYDQDYYEDIYIR